MTAGQRSRFDTLDLFRVVSVWGIVLLHVHLLSGGSYDDTLIRARDFAMPVLIMASFFVMAISFDRHPDRPFSRFAAGRVRRILVPSLAWSLLYWIGWWMIRPLATGTPVAPPPLSLALTSYVHLWYLHFIFLAAVLLAPVLIGVARGHLPRHAVALASLAGAVLTLFVVQPRLIDLTRDVLYRQFDSVAYPAPDWKTCVSRVAPFLGYAPLGLALALWHRQIGSWHARAWTGPASVAAAVLMLAVHLTAPGYEVTRPLFALAVFVAILRPIASGSFSTARTLAEWTYVIYILHFGFAMVFVALVQRLGLERTAMTSLCGSAIVFAASLAAGAALRRVPLAAPLLPLVPVSPSAVSTAGTWRAAASSAPPPQPTS
jgi:peptidoglycan/LPS O-acetylase OafA/YrhL